MKTNFLIPIISAVFLGYVCANFVISEYNRPQDKENNTVYFLELEKEDKTIKNQIILKEETNHTYIGMTMDKNIAKKIKKIYREDNIDLLIQKKNIDNISFISDLEQYDILLKNTTNRKEIDSILGSILSSFEENNNIS